MSSSLDIRRKYYRACNPDEPISPDDPRWIDLSTLRGSGQDVTNRILERVQLEDESETVLVTGFRGTGKTSLLRACQLQLEDAGYRVIYADAESDYIVRTFEPINLNDILLVVAMAITDANLGPGYASQLWKDLLSLGAADVIPQGIDVTAGPVAFKTVLQRAPSLRERLRELARKKSLFEQIAELIVGAQSQVKKAGQQGIVVIVDGLDHLTDPAHTTNSPVTDSVLETLEYSFELNRLGIHLILTVPPTILPYAHQLRPIYGEPLIVPEARIFSREGQRDIDSFRVMEKFVSKRLPMSAFDSDVSVDSLIAASGGYLRDLLRSLRDCLLDIRDLPITSDVVHRVVDKGIAIAGELPIADYVDDVRALMENPTSSEFRSTSDQQRMYAMIRDRVALRYSNGEPWEGVHPYVMARLDRARFDRLVFPESAA